MHKVGDVIITKTGKVRVITGIHRACPPDEFAARMARFEAGQGVKPSDVDWYYTRCLRDGKPYGPERAYTEDKIQGR
jgi:hypothetical protein